MRPIDADELLKRVDEERQYLLARGQEGAEHILVNNFRVLIDNAPTVDTYTEDDVHYAIKEGHEVGYGMAKAKFGRPQGDFTIDELRMWLCEIAFNNDNDFGLDCLEIIDRLDGFERFVADMRGGKR